MFVRVALLFRNVWISLKTSDYIFSILVGAIMRAVKIFNRYPRIPYGVGFIIPIRQRPFNPNLVNCITFSWR